MERSRLSGLYRALFAYLISFGALALLVYPTVADVFSRWLKFDESYSHGFLLLAVSVLVSARKWFAQPPLPGFYPVWLIPFLIALSGYVVGGVLRVEALQELVLIPLLLAAFAVLAGWDQGKHYILPVGVLIFAMPFWDYLSWPLQLITVAVNDLGLGLLDIEFSIDGVYVYLTGVGAFEVANGCSGLRYLLVGQSLALLYGELNLRTVRSRALLFVAAVLLSLLANWVRVLVIIYVGHESNMQSSLTEDHDGFGWWVFAAALVPLFFLGRQLEKSPAEQAAGPGEGSGSENPRLKFRRWYVGPLCVAAAAMVSALLVPSYARVKNQVADSYHLRLDGTQYAPAFAAGLEGWRPHIKNADRVFQQTLFERGKFEERAGVMPGIFYVSVYSYDYQRHGAEVVQYFNRLYSPDDWRPEDAFSLQGPGGKRLKGITLANRLSGKQIHVAYGYYVEGFWETDQLRAKLSQITGLLNERIDASQIIYGVACGQCDPVAALTPLVNRSLPMLLNAIDEHYQ